jgi:hypothetical protein
MIRIPAPFFRALCLPAALLAVLLCLTQIAAASDVTFNGAYRFSHVVEDGSQVHVTVTMTLFNGGNADVKGGIVAVLDSQPHPALLGSFNAIKTLPHLQSVTVSHTITVPAAEYATWKDAHAPRFEFLMPSGDIAIAVPIQAHQEIQPVKAAN